MPTVGGNLRRLREALRVTKALVERAVAAGVSEEDTQHWVLGKHLTQGALGQIIGVSQPTVARWEKDEVLPDDDTLERICEWLECTREELLPDSTPGALEAQINQASQEIPELSDVVRTIGLILPELAISDPKELLEIIAAMPEPAQRMVEAYVYGLRDFLLSQSEQIYRTFYLSPTHTDTRGSGQPIEERGKRKANGETG